MKILSDTVVSNLLKEITISDIQNYQKSLVDALLEYSNDRSLIPSRIVTTTPFCTHLFMASIGSNVGMKAITGSKAGFQGITTILDKHEGFPIGILNAKTLTAFRTSLCTSLTLVKTFPVEGDCAKKPSGNLICFGIGGQAEWHTRLALILYPNCFDKVIIINRSINETANELVNNLQSEFPNESVRLVATNDTQIPELFEAASVIFSCIPSTSPTILNSYLIGNKQDKVFIGTIGSYKPHMIEIEGELIKEQCLGKLNGKVVVDSTHHCLEEAGEFIQNDIKEDKLIEVAELYKDELSEEAVKQLEYIKNEKVVISKIVGLAIMDVSIGAHVLREAEKANVGVDLDDF